MDKREAKLTHLDDISLRDLYVPSPFCPLPDLLYYLAGDEDEYEIQVYQAVPKFN